MRDRTDEILVACGGRAGGPEVSGMVSHTAQRDVCVLRLYSLSELVWCICRRLSISCAVNTLLYYCFVLYYVCIICDY